MATTDEIITRIKRRLSRGSTTQHDELILDELQQTQEWLEGKPTLPSWITNTENIGLAAATDTFTVEDFAETFLRFHDDNPVQIANPDADSDEESWLPLPRFVSEEELKSRHPGTGELRGWSFNYPNVFFRQIPEESISVKVRYYYRAEAMAVGNETVWTQNASELIIAHTGFEVAQFLRDSNAMKYFERKEIEAYRDYYKRLVAEEVAGLHSSRGED